jgi:hypothetical protein
MNLVYVIYMPTKNMYAYFKFRVSTRFYENACPMLAREVGFLAGSRLHLRIAHTAHIICIQLAGQIWGEFHRHTFHSSPKPRPSVTVPSSSIQVVLPAPLVKFSLPSSS